MSTRPPTAVPVLFTGRCEKNDDPRQRELAEHVRREIEAWRDQGFPNLGEGRRYRRVPTPKMWIFHAPAGFRGIAWHQKDDKRRPPIEVVWICAFGYEPHIGESGPNVYDWAAELDEKYEPSRLMPQRPDFERYEGELLRLGAEASIASARASRRSGGEI